MKLTLKADIVPAVDVLTADAIRKHHELIERSLREGLTRRLTEVLGNRSVAEIAVNATIDYISNHAILEHPANFEL